MRRYASEAGPAKSSQLPWILTGAAILGIGGYFTLAKNPEKAHEVAHKAEEKVKSVAGSASDAASKKVFTGGGTSAYSQFRSTSEASHGVRWTGMLTPHRTRVHQSRTRERREHQPQHQEVPIQVRRRRRGLRSPRRQCSFDQVQGPRDGEARHPPLHSHQ